MKIENANTIKEFNAVSGQTFGKGTIGEISTTVVPVVNINPKDYKQLQVAIAENTTSGAAGIVQFSSTNITAVHGYTLSFAKNAACDMASRHLCLSAKVNGIMVNFATLPTITLTAQSAEISHTFAHPMIVDKGSIITIEQPASYSAGVMIKCASIYYTETVPNEF